MNMDEQKFVSVIIPVYNNQEQLKLCLSALASQTYPQELYEIIVVDNSSEEDIDKVTQPFQQVRLTTESKRSSYAARNQGIKIAKGELIAFTDSDCIPNPDWLEKGINHLLSAPNCGVIAGKIELFYQNKDNPNAAEIFDKIVNLRQEKYVTEKHYGATANLFTFKRIFHDVGLFDSNLKSGGDCDWGNRVFAHDYKIIYADDVLILHPARNSLKQLVKKVIRQTGGAIDRERKKNDKQKQKLSFHQILNYSIRLRPPLRSAVRKSLLARELKNTFSKIELTLIIIMMHYLRLSEEVRLKLGGKSKG